jgi:hypothetical protein
MNANERCIEQLQLLGSLKASGGYKPPAGWEFKNSTAHLIR